MTFLVAIHKEPQSCYGVSVPDLPGCISAGDTLTEALLMAEEAIQLYLESMLDDDQMLPDPSTDIEQLRHDPNYADAFWGVVKVHLDWRRKSPPTPLSQI
jgi:predicted RNase H-like HicB family nuclease